METLNHTRTGAWTHPLAQIVRRLRSHRVARRLTALDDHLLKDIGLTRGDIDAALVEGRF